MNGKTGRAPCGHPGFHVIGTFVRCAHGCKDDSKPVLFCPVCFTLEVEPFRILLNAWTGEYGDAWHCKPNGHVFEK